MACWGHPDHNCWGNIYIDFPKIYSDFIQIKFKKVLDMWINKIDNSSIEECINVIEPIIRSEIGLKTSLKIDSITSDDLESKIIEGISQSEKQLFVKTLQTIEKIKYSNHKDLDLLKTTVKELAESL